MKMKRVLLVLWLIMLVLDIAFAVTGHEPTWIMVFCPLVCYIAELISGCFASD